MAASTGKKPRSKPDEARSMQSAYALRRERRVRRAADNQHAPQKKAAAKSLNAPKPKACVDYGSGVDAAEEKDDEAKRAEASAEDIEVPVEAIPVPADGEETPSTNRAPRADEKVVGKKKAPSGKKRAPVQVPAMWNSALPTPGGDTPTHAASASSPQSQDHVAADVEAAVAGIIFLVEVGETSEAAPSIRTSPEVQSSTIAKGKRAGTRSSRKRRRLIIHDESEEGEDDSAKSSGAEDDNSEATTAEPTCFVDGDPNMMDSGAQTCTGLNSDEDEDLHEEAEDEDDAEDDDCTWVSD
ncbi:hypothetical protein PInf_017668 [Phytophthora infestans]|nr:hypothetical protein PInf_017668 [Phytophthora infestans]